MGTLFAQSAPLYWPRGCNSGAWVWSCAYFKIIQNCILFPAHACRSNAFGLKEKDLVQRLSQREFPLARCLQKFKVGISVFIFKRLYESTFQIDCFAGKGEDKKTYWTLKTLQLVLSYNMIFFRLLIVHIARYLKSARPEYVLFFGVGVNTVNNVDAGIVVTRTRIISKNNNCWVVGYNEKKITPGSHTDFYKSL